MSTNFYAVRVPSTQDYQDMQDALTNKQLRHLRELIDKSTEKIHIGKRSGGWQFLFESRRAGAPWRDDTLEAIKEYLSSKVRIINEYGDEFGPDAFWEEIQDYLYRDEKHINGTDYDRKDPSHTYIYRCDDVEFTNKEGIRFSTTEFS